MTTSVYIRRKITVFSAILCWHLTIASCLHAQRPRFPDYFQPATVAPQSQAPLNQGAFLSTVPAQAGPIAPPPATIAAPVFDPFQSSTQPLPFNPTPGVVPADTTPNLLFPGQNVEVLPPVQPQIGQPQIGQPQFFNQPPGFNQPFGFQQPQFQNNQQFPRSSQTGQFLKRFRDDYLPRLLERPRIRHTYIPGQNGNEIQIHDTEIATTLTFPRFLWSEQPVRVTPGFIAHFWDGPVTAGSFGTGFDLPETAFSAFLTLEHVSDPNRRAGVESNFTVGVYSDYEHLTSDSLRITGVGLGWIRLNQTNVFKFGVEYFDRLELKLLPAFGLFIRPTQDIQIDLYFPRPRISQRIPNFRGLETWAYVAGEYGGGNWTVERLGGLDDRIDINDYRAILGVEWYGQRGITAFVETGYVFERELISAAAIPTRKLDLQDSFMLRMGLEF